MIARTSWEETSWDAALTQYCIILVKASQPLETTFLPNLLPFLGTMINLRYAPIVIAIMESNNYRGTWKNACPGHFTVTCIVYMLWNGNMCRIVLASLCGKECIARTMLVTWVPYLRLTLALTHCLRGMSSKSKYMPVAWRGQPRSKWIRHGNAKPTPIPAALSLSIVQINVKN